jgi:hypothetical protein
MHLFKEEKAMNKIKRFLAGSLAVMMAASVMTACGKDEKKKGVDKEANEEAAKVGPLVLKKADRVKQTAEGSEDSKKTLRIYTWNEEFKDRFRAYYPEYDAANSEIGGDEFLKDGTKIVWVTTPTTDNAYQNKLDEDLKAQAASTEKIDIFLVEADYALKYVNGPYTQPVKELGLTDADLANMYEYTKTVCTDANGDLQGVSWQATPGLFAYRRDIAKTVLGTDDPVEVQKALADWTKFEETAKKMKDAGYFMLSGYDDAYRTFSNNVSATWVNANYEIVIDDNLMKWVDQTKNFTDKGYNNGTSLWAPEWSADQGSEGKVFGFFYSTWGINFTLLENAEDNKGAKDGLYGQYAVCEGPQNYYWGGTWICAADGTDNKELVGDIMKKLTCDATIAEKITVDTQDYTNNKPAMDKLAGDFASEFLGGQNHIALFAGSAPNIDISNMGPYDQGLNESFQGAMKDYFTGKVDKDTALENFYKAAIEKYPELKKPGK